MKKLKHFKMIKVDQDTHDKYKKMSIVLNMKMYEFMDYIINEYIKNNKNQNEK